MKKLLSLLLVALAAASLQAQPAWVQIQHPQAPSVPEYVVFAGDTVRFDRTDFYERMDRELISFTYMHTNTTLMLKRSRRYFAQIVPILRQQGVPEDLKYLMAIESRRPRPTGWRSAPRWMNVTTSRKRQSRPASSSRTPIGNTVTG